MLVVFTPPISLVRAFRPIIGSRRDTARYPLRLSDLLSDPLSDQRQRQRAGRGARWLRRQAGPAAQREEGAGLGRKPGQAGWAAAVQRRRKKAKEKKFGLLFAY